MPRHRTAKAAAAADERTGWRRMRMAALATIGACVIAGAIAGPAFSSDTPADRQALATRFVATPAQQDALTVMTSQASMKAQLAAVMPGMEGPGLDVIASSMADAMTQNRTAIERVMVQTAAKHFTVAELEAMMAFQQTPEGAAVAWKQHAFMAEVTRAMSETISRAMTGGMMGGALR